MLYIIAVALFSISVIPYQLTTAWLLEFGDQYDIKCYTDSITSLLTISTNMMMVVVFVPIVIPMELIFFLLGSSIQESSPISLSLMALIASPVAGILILSLYYLASYSKKLSTKVISNLYLIKDFLR